MSKQTDLINVTDAITVSGSNVGIGTSSPSFGDSAKGLEVKRTGGNVSVRVNYDGSAQGQFTATNSSIKLETRTAGIPLVFGTAAVERMRIDSSGNVGIGAVPSKKLHLAATDVSMYLDNTNANGQAWELKSTNGASPSTGALQIKDEDGHFWMAFNENAGSNYTQFFTNNTERMRIDSSGNLLVGTTSNNIYGGTTTGINLNPNGATSFNRASGQAAMFNRISTDGDIVQFRKDGSVVGSINVSGGDLGISSSGANPLRLRYDGNSVALVNSSNFGPNNDNFFDLGSASLRWDDVYATNGTIQTSDRNEKQDIEVLSDAETRVAQACKGLLRKFRWQDAVAKKGDDARIHFGIIAQDLQDAFAAEGLDAGRYAMFISSTWWETQTEVPAVEAVDAVYEDVVIPAVLDEEGNELEAERTEQQLVTEAVEAKDAYTRTDTYETQAEAPEGATERTRLGVRYPELLAFIIGAN